MGTAILTALLGPPLVDDLPSAVLPFVVVAELVEEVITLPSDRVAVVKADKEAVLDELRLVADAEVTDVLVAAAAAERDAATADAEAAAAAAVSAAGSELTAVLAAAVLLAAAAPEIPLPAAGDADAAGVFPALPVLPVLPPLLVLLPPLPAVSPPELLPLPVLLLPPPLLPLLLLPPLLLPRAVVDAGVDARVDVGVLRFDVGDAEEEVVEPPPITLPMPLMMLPMT